MEKIKWQTEWLWKCKARYQGRNRSYQKTNEYKELNLIYLMKDILYFTKNTIIFYILIFEFYLLPSYANIYERATSFGK